MILQIADKDFAFLGISVIGYNMLWMFLGGATISVLSQMGFFAYLIVRFIAIGIFRNKWTWDMLQIIVIIIALFDLVYLPYVSFSSDGGFWGYLPLPLIMLAVAVLIAYWKTKMTNKSAFIPTLFFMSAVTIMEGVPALKLNNAASTVYMLVPLVACNAWQILILHKVLETKKEPA